MTAEGKAAVVERLMREGAVAVLRGADAKQVYQTACTLLEGGVGVLEVTLTVPDAFDLIRRLVNDTEGLVGAGSVRSPEDVDRCVDAGARLIVSPACMPEMVRRAVERKVVVIPGAMTPTEILQAWELGADMVKVFPAARLGPAFLKDIHGPLPEIPLVPTGGLDGDNAGGYLDAGAALVCFGSWLTKGGREQLLDRARTVRTLVDEHRGRSG
jgi:2-dehydro-3-deoxyphosphogluconate aldolase/(4S)-4-hydroxy-2-oxoglutarate aldolase